MSLLPGYAEASELRIAAWNLEHLNDRHGEGCVERSEEDFDAIAHRIEALGADVVAFQEVENAAAARRVFDPAKWNIVMPSRPATSEGPTCYNRPDRRLLHQGTGVAVRRSVGYRTGTDLSSLAGAVSRSPWHRRGQPVAETAQPRPSGRGTREMASGAPDTWPRNSAMASRRVADGGCSDPTPGSSGLVTV